VQFKSLTLQKYVSADNGGGMNVTVDRDVPSSWETFKVRRLFCFCFFGINPLVTRGKGSSNPEFSREVSKI
jgi:hypothetical protein